MLRLFGRPLRLDTTRLAVPGVLGMRDPAGLSFDRERHVLLGPDAGFPEFQPLDEWKCDIAMIDGGALSPDLRAEVGIQSPEERLAELQAQDREMAGFDGPPLSDPRELARLAVLERARLMPLDGPTREALEVRDVPLWIAGFTRHSSTLWVHRIGGPAPFKAWANMWDAELDTEPADEARPSWMTRERYYALYRTRWADRVLRALSDGAVSETGLLFARRRWAGWDFDGLVEDEAVHAAVGAAAQMVAGADEALLPWHGVVLRVRLPAFTQQVWEVHPLDARGAGPSPTRHLKVPAEDVWVPGKQGA